MFHQVRKYLLLIKSDADPKYGSCCVSVCLVFGCLDVCLGVSGCLGHCLSGCVWVCLGVSRCLGIWVAISVDADPPTRPPTSRPSLAFTHTLSLPRSLALSLSFAISRHTLSRSLSFAISRHTLALFRYLPSHPLSLARSRSFSLSLSCSLALALLSPCPGNPQVLEAQPAAACRRPQPRRAWLLQQHQEGRAPGDRWV